MAQGFIARVRILRECSVANSDAYATAELVKHYMTDPQPDSAPKQLLVKIYLDDSKTVEAEIVIKPTHAIQQNAHFAYVKGVVGGDSIAAYLATDIGYLYGGSVRPGVG